MKAFTYIEQGKFAMRDKPVPVPAGSRGRHCPGDHEFLSVTSDLHIKHGSVPRAVPGITVGHEMVGVVEQTGPGVSAVRPGDRVTVNVETFCGGVLFLQDTGMSITAQIQTADGLWAAASTAARRSTSGCPARIRD